MKVLQIINSLTTAGAEKLLLDTIPLYRAAGIEMDILVFWNNNHLFIDELKSLKCCKVFVLKESDSFKDIYSLSHILKIRKYLREYDIAHVHLFPAQYFAALANILIGSKCKLIFTEHSTSNRRIRNRFFKIIDRFCYKNYKKIICITEEVMEVLKKHTSFPVHKFEIITNGVSIEKFQIAEPILKDKFFKNSGNELKFVIQVSSFQEPKDQLTLIKSLKYLRLNVKLLLVGDGVLRSECEVLVQKLQLQDRVLFLGLRMDIPQLLKSADVVVLSSKYEGLSLSCIEGMSSGRPFVASNVPGLSNIVGGGWASF